MTAGLMRCIPPSRLARAHRLTARNRAAAAPATARRHGVRAFAKVQQPEGTQTGGWFSASTPGPLPPDHKGEGGKPPDERTLKLGKSESTAPSNDTGENFPSIDIGAHSYSNPPRAPAYTASVSAAPRDSVAPNHTAPLSIHAPASTHRQWAHRIYSRALDRTSCLGKGSGCRQRQA